MHTVGFYIDRDSPLRSVWMDLSDAVRERILQDGGDLLPYIAERVLGGSGKVPQDLERSAPYLELFVNLALWTRTHTNGAVGLRKSDGPIWTRILSREPFRKLFEDGLYWWQKAMLADRLSGDTPGDSARKDWETFTQTYWPAFCQRKAMQKVCNRLTQAISCAPFRQKEVLDFLNEEGDTVELDRIFRTLAAVVILNTDGHCAAWTPDAVFAVLKRVRDMRDGTYPPIKGAKGGDPFRYLADRRCPDIEEAIQQSFPRNRLEAHRLSKQWRAHVDFTVGALGRLLKHPWLDELIASPAPKFWRDARYADFGEVFVNFTSSVVYLSPDSVIGSEAWQRYAQPFEDRNESWLFLAWKASGLRFRGKPDPTKERRYGEQKARYLLRVLASVWLDWGEVDTWIREKSPWEAQTRRRLWNLKAILQRAVIEYQHGECSTIEDAHYWVHALEHPEKSVEDDRDAE